MTTLESQRHTAIFGVACFGIDATEDTGVGTCDAQNTCRGRWKSERGDIQHRLVSKSGYSLPIYWDVQSQEAQSTMQVYYGVGITLLDG